MAAVSGFKKRILLSLNRISQRVAEARTGHPLSARTHWGIRDAWYKKAARPDTHHVEPNLRHTANRPRRHMTPCQWPGKQDASKSADTYTQTHTHTHLVGQTFVTPQCACDDTWPMAMTWQARHQHDRTRQVGQTFVTPQCACDDKRSMAKA